MQPPQMFDFLFLFVFVFFHRLHFFLRGVQFGLHFHQVGHLPVYYNYFLYIAGRIKDRIAGDQHFDSIAQAFRHRIDLFFGPDDFRRNGVFVKSVRHQFRHIASDDFLRLNPGNARIRLVDVHRLALAVGDINPVIQMVADFTEIVFMRFL